MVQDATWIAGLGLATVYGIVKQSGGYIMPKMSGQTLALRLTADRPELHVLYMSGFTDDSIVRRGALTTAASYLQKPFTTETLVAKIREALARPRGPDTT